MNSTKCKSFKNTKGFQAQADVAINSPSQSNSQNVNLYLQDNSLTKDREFRIISNPKVIKKDVDLQVNTTSTINIDEPALSDSLEENFKEKSIASAKENLEELDNILKNKDSLIEALYTHTMTPATPSRYALLVFTAIVYDESINGCFILSNEMILMVGVNGWSVWLGLLVQSNVFMLAVGRAVESWV